MIKINTFHCLSMMNEGLFLYHIVAESARLSHQFGTSHINSRQDGKGGFRSLSLILVSSSKLRTSAHHKIHRQVNNQFGSVLWWQDSEQMPRDGVAVRKRRAHYRRSDSLFRIQMRRWCAFTSAGARSVPFMQLYFCSDLLSNHTISRLVSSLSYRLKCP